MVVQEKEGMLCDHSHVSLCCSRNKKKRKEKEKSNQRK